MPLRASGKPRAVRPLALPVLAQAMSPQDRGQRATDLWLVLAFSEPPAGWGFARAASGKCWWRRIEGRGWAMQLGEKLAEQGIHGVCKRVKNNQGWRSDRAGLVAIGTVLKMLGP